MLCIEVSNSKSTDENILSGVTTETRKVKWYHWSNREKNQINTEEGG